MNSTSTKIMAVLVVAFMLGAGLTVLAYAPEADVSGESASTTYTADSYPSYEPNPPTGTKLSELVQKLGPKNSQDLGYLTIYVQEDGSVLFMPNATLAVKPTSLVVDMKMTRDPANGTDPFTMTITQAHLCVVEGGDIDFVVGNESATNKGTINVGYEGYFEVYKGGKVHYWNGNTDMIVNVIDDGQLNIMSPVTQTGGVRGPGQINVIGGKAQFNYAVEDASDYIREVNVKEGARFLMAEECNANLVMKNLTLNNAADFYVAYDESLIIGGVSTAGVESYITGRMNVTNTSIYNYGTFVVGGSAGPDGTRDGTGTLNMAGNDCIFVNYGYFFVNSYYFSKDTQTYYSSSATFQNYRTTEIEGQTYTCGFFNLGSVTIMGGETTGYGIPDVHMTVYNPMVSAGAINIYTNGKLHIGDLYVSKEVEFLDAGIYFFGESENLSTEGIYVHSAGVEFNVTLNSGVELDSAKFMFFNDNDGFSTILLDGVVMGSAVHMGYDDGSAFVRDGYLLGSTVFGALLDGIDIILTTGMIGIPECWLVGIDGDLIIANDYRFSVLYLYGGAPCMRTNDGSTHYITVSPSAGYRVPSASTTNGGDYDFESYTGISFAVDNDGIVSGSSEAQIYFLPCMLDGTQTGVKSIYIDGEIGNSKWFAMNDVCDLTQIKVVCNDGYTFDGWYEMKIVDVLGEPTVVYNKVMDPENYHATPGAVLVAKALPSAPVVVDHDYTLLFTLILLVLAVMAILVAMNYVKRNTN